MKVLWFCNMQLPDISQDLGEPVSPYGGWLSGLSSGLVENKEIDLFICVPGRKNGKQQGKINGYTYYIFNSSDTSVDEFCKIIKVCNPNVIHIFGTEYSHSLNIIRAAVKCGLQDKTVVSIQGLISVYGRRAHYYAGLPYKVIKAWTLWDLLKRKNIYFSQKSFVKSGANEVETINLVHHIIGRTDWDQACVAKINPDAVYHHCNESLRDSFYSAKWKLESCEKHSIFVSQSAYPIKGFHFVIEAFADVLKNYPDAHLYTTGRSPLNLDLLSKIKQTSYGKYIGKLIKNNRLQDKITFLGVLNEKQMCSRYLHTHVFISPSSIENSPNSLGEAMLLGVPTVSSDVGGVKNMMTHNSEGLLYPFDEPYMLAYYIMKLFSDDELAQKMSENARKHALKTHDRDANTRVLVQIYADIAVGMKK